MPLEDVTERQENPQKKKKRPTPVGKAPNWTPETAKIASAKGNWTKKMLAERRKAYKQAVMEKLTPDKFSGAFLEALENRNKDEMTAVIEASKFLGCHFDQSEDCVKNLNVKADVKKAGTVKLVIEDMTKPIEEA